MNSTIRALIAGMIISMLMPAYNEVYSKDKQDIYIKYNITTELLKLKTRLTSIDKRMYAQQLKLEHDSFNPDKLLEFLRQQQKSTGAIDESQKSSRRNIREE
jgi:hypothetical protein